MVIIDIVINTILGRLSLDPAGMHCPARTMLLFLVLYNVMTAQQCCTVAASLRPIHVRSLD